MDQRENDEQLSALADLLIARATRFLHDLTEGRELKEQREASAATATKLAEVEAELRSLRAARGVEVAALEARLAEVEQSRGEASRRAEEAEDKVRALEAAAEQRERVPEAEEVDSASELESELRERNALVEELELAISAQRATIAKRERALADLASQLEACRAQLASPGATV